MLVILLDAAVILGLVSIFSEGEMPGWGTAIGTALAVGCGFMVFARLLGPSIGVFSLLPMAAIAGVLLWIACDVPIRNAMIAGVILFVYKIVLFFFLLAVLN